MKVRTRFAPSPTGNLHIGGIRAALYPYALAKKNDGEFILRIEDTDQTRKVEKGEEKIMQDMENYGLEWDEFYRQSDRQDIYKEYAEKLVESKNAYYSFETKEELDNARQLAQDNKQVFRYRSPNRDMPLGEAKERVANGDSYVIRLKSPEEEELIFTDVVQGSMKFNTREVDDTVLLKSDGFPTYHLAVVVDDHLMEITHVLRGFGWIPSIPKHILIYRAFGWEMPVHGHMTDILNPDGKGKLSKRHGAVSANSFLERGYLPEAILNFLMLLGWSSPEARQHGKGEREFFSMEDFIEMFDLKDLNKSNQRFDPQKLDWFNQSYIQTLELDDLENRFTNWLKKYSDDKELKSQINEKGPDFLQEIIKLEHTRIKTLADLPESIKFFYEKPNKVDLLGLKKLKKLSKEQAHLVLSDYVTILEDEDLEKMSHDDWEVGLRKLADGYELKHGLVFMVLRVAITGSTATPPLFETMQILGKEEVLERIKTYL